MDRPDRRRHRTHATRISSVFFSAVLWQAASAAAPPEEPALRPESAGHLSAASTEVRALRSRIERLAAGDEVEVTGEAIASHKLIPAFYQARRFTPVWDQPGRVRQLLHLIEQSRAHGLDPDDYHVAPIRNLVGNGQVLDAADRELICTDALIRLAYHLHFGKVNPRELYPDWSFSRSLGNIDPVQALEAVFASDDIKTAIERYAPQLPIYERLRVALKRYREIKAAGGWPTVPAGPALQPGLTDDRVIALRARLKVTGELSMPAGADLRSYDAAVEQAVRIFQLNHGLEPDGKVGRETLAALNVDVDHILQQLLVNLERLRWVAQDLTGDYLLVDIAGFRAELSLHGEIVWDSKVVVGRAYRKTPTFRATVRSVVLNPTWTVPPTILREDLLPKLRDDPGYLARTDMHLVDMSGHPVDAASVNWWAYGARSFPYLIVQAAGPTNPLGRLKFNMPNSYNVYLHDTSSKELFDKTTRAFSSGCIRLQKPAELAVLLLDDGEHWDATGLSAAIDAGITRTVPLKHSVPVMLLYFTAYVSDDGTVNVRPDLYQRDGEVLAGLQAPFRFSPVDSGSRRRESPRAQ